VEVDIATLLGLFGGIAVIVAAIASGSELLGFLNIPGLLIVLAGTLAATLIKFPFNQFLESLRLAVRVFRFEQEKPAEIIRLANALASKVRQRGVLALDDEQVPNALMQKGLQLAVDGHPPEFVRRVLQKEVQLSLERHEVGERLFRAIGESAPAFGMIGTLIGLIQMLSNMQDPKSIGPAMAIALLTTLYGAMIANLIALPIADKLEARTREERILKLLIIESMASIQQGQNPRIMDEMLETYLSHDERQQLTALLQAGEAEEAT
jgi:chemotaxis protein MotA